MISDRFTYSTRAYQGYGSGVPLLRALDSLIRSTPAPALRELLKEIRAAVSDGKTLTDALRGALETHRPDTVLGAFTIDSVAGEVLVVASSVAVDRLERWPLAAEAVSPSSVSPRSVVSLGVASVVSLDSDAGLTVLATSEFTAPVTVSHPQAAVLMTVFWARRPFGTAQFTV